MTDNATATPETISAAAIMENFAALLDDRLETWEPPAPPALQFDAGQELDGLDDHVVDRVGGKLAIRPKSEILAEAEQLLMGKSLTAPIEGPLNGIFPAIPLGSIVAGSVPGVIAGEVVDAFVSPFNADGKPNITNAAVKAALAYGVATYGKKYASKQTITFAVAALGVQVISDYVDLRKLAGRIVGLLRRDSSAVAQAQQIVNSNATTMGIAGDQGRVHVDPLAAFVG